MKTPRVLLLASLYVLTLCMCTHKHPFPYYICIFTYLCVCLSYLNLGLEGKKWLLTAWHWIIGIGLFWLWSSVWKTKIGNKYWLWRSSLYLCIEKNINGIICPMVQFSFKENNFIVLCVMDSVRMKSTIVAIVIVGLGMWELIVEVTVSSWKSWVEIFILQFFLLKFYHC